MAASVREQMVRELLMGVLGMTAGEAAENGFFTDAALSPREMAEIEDEILGSWPAPKAGEAATDARKA